MRAHPLLLASMALLASCQSDSPTPEADPQASHALPPRSANRVLGTLPTGQIELSDQEVAQVTEGLFESMPWIHQGGPFAVKASGTTGAMPLEAAGLRFTPWKSEYPFRGLDLRFLTREQDQLTIQAYVINPIGGPSIYDVLFLKNEGQWTVYEVLSSTEYL